MWRMNIFTGSSDTSMFSMLVVHPPSVQGLDAIPDTTGTLHLPLPNYLSSHRIRIKLHEGHNVKIGHLSRSNVILGELHTFTRGALLKLWLMA